MRFHLIDRIVEVQPGRAIHAVKNLTLGEEYLADHFPTFPVMPGVLMLETLVQASAWLLRIDSNFEHSVITLREARNVKYGNFMEPGRQLRITAELVEKGNGLATFKGKGEAEGTLTVSAKLTLRCRNLRDLNPDLRATDERIVEDLRRVLGVLKGELRSV